MERINFRTTVEEVSETKYPKTVIESGYNRHFIHSLGSFLTYEKGNSKIVKSESGRSTVVGQGTVRFPLND